MSVRVNLLPEATRSKGRANQVRGVALLAGLVLLAVLGGVWWWAASEVRDAEVRLADAQAVSASLRADDAELVAYRDLANRRDRAQQVLSTAMLDEVSLAGVLQDIAAVMPPDAQLDTLTITVEPVQAARPDIVGAFTMTGQTLTSHAPGVERMLISLEKIATFGELFLNSSTLNTELDQPIAIYSVDGVVRREARTDRYADGLPGELR